MGTATISPFFLLRRPKVLEGDKDSPLFAGANRNLRPLFGGYGPRFESLLPEAKQNQKHPQGAL